MLHIHCLRSIYNPPNRVYDHPEWVYDGKDVVYDPQRLFNDILPMRPGHLREFLIILSGSLLIGVSGEVKFIDYFYIVQDGSNNK